MPRRIMVVIGTRPECLKLAPVIEALRARPSIFAPPIVCSSGQHREMLDQAAEAVGLVFDLDLRLMRPSQGLTDITAALLVGLAGAIRAAQPDRLLVQGDTATAFAAALAANYERIPVAHVEAGLRSGERLAPFPEEVNRRLVSVLADLHFAPTQKAVDALLAEGVSPDRIHLTGNTIVDAVARMQDRFHEAAGPYPASTDLRRIFASGAETVLVTCHRRESFGGDLASICRALGRIAAAFPRLKIIFPVHLNPKVREGVFAALGSAPNICLMDPLPHADLLFVLSRASLVLTDSGGIQEEAPSFLVPTLVLRRVTERSEAVEAGLAELVGTDEDRIVERACARLAQGRRADAPASANPFGDGHAAERIAAVLAQTE